MAARILPLILLLTFCCAAQTLLDDAYRATRESRLEQAADLFQQGLLAQPDHQLARKDYAYLLLRLGESIAARDQFQLISENDPSDFHSRLEFAFLCFETGKRSLAYAIFNQIRKTNSGTTAETAERVFQQIDENLQKSIAQWHDAIQKQPQSDSAHEELARRAEDRNDFTLAEKHFAEAYRLKPVREEFLLDLGRIRQQLNQQQESFTTYVAASLSSDIRIAEQAREKIAGKQLTPEILSAARSHLAAPVIPLRTERKTAEVSVLAMADRSFEQSYLQDALRYYESAQEAAPDNSYIQLRLGLTQNLLGRDNLALDWLRKARKSKDPMIAAEANRAWKNLRPDHAPFRITAWTLPMYSSRWQSGFAYGQVKAELNRKWILRPYLSLRFATDGGAAQAPGPLSERAFTPAAGVTSRPWHNIIAWAEAGGNVGNTQGFDTRSGIVHTKGWGSLLNAESPGFFHLMENAMNYASRFSHNAMISSQNRTGYTFGPWQISLFFAASTDTRREYWANYYEVGPSLRTRIPGLPKNTFLSTEFVRGHNYVQQGNPRPSDYFDLRIGFWYAFTY